MGEKVDSICMECNRLKNQPDTAALISMECNRLTNKPDAEALISMECNLLTNQPDAAALARYGALLRCLYGIKASELVEVRGGWSARAFLVKAAGDGEGGARFFLKAYDNTRSSVIPWIARIDNYIHVLAWLSQTPTLSGRVASPVAADGGGYKARLGDEVLLVFDYVEGITPGYGQLSGAQKCELAGILAILHGFGVELPVDTRGLKEDISLWFCQALRAYLEGEPGDEPGLYMRRHKATLLTIIDKTTRLRGKARAGAVALSPCHTDAHGGNVIQGERLVLVDWEGLCLAPAEADLFMFAGDDDWPAVLDAYRAARSGYALNRDLLMFYRCRRIVEDIWFDILCLRGDDPDEAQRRQVYSYIEGNMETARRLMDYMD